MSKYPLTQLINLLLIVVFGSTLTACGDSADNTRPDDVVVEQPEDVSGGESEPQQPDEESQPEENDGESGTESPPENETPSPTPESPVDEAPDPTPPVEEVPSPTPPVEENNLICELDDTAAASVPETLPETYIKNCSGCHGKDGNSGVDARLLNTALSEAEFFEITRIGRDSAPLPMPAFGEPEVSEVELKWIFAFMKKQAIPLVCRNGDEKPTISDEAFAEAKTQGINSWRKACVNCHGPDPIEFVYYDYTAADILRRGLKFLPKDDLDNINAFVQAFRIRYDWQPLDPRVERPLQPGDPSVEDGRRVLAPEGQALDLVATNMNTATRQRDAVYCQVMNDSGNAFFNKDLQSLADAQAAINALANINLRRMPSPIPHNRWTEDPFNDPGTKNSIAEWIPAAEHEVVDANALFEATDTYLENPNRETFLTWYQQHKNLTRLAAGESETEARKYASVQSATHFFRMEIMAKTGERFYDFAERDPVDNMPLIWQNNPRYQGSKQNSTEASFNDIWFMGRFARDFGGGWPAQNVSNNFLSPAADEGQNFSAQELMTQGAQLRSPWFYPGTLLEPTGLWITEDHTTESWEYFTMSTLLDGGYPCFMSTILAMRSQLLLSSEALVNRNPNLAIGAGLRWPYGHTEQQSIAGLSVANREFYQHHILNGLFPLSTSFAENKGGVSEQRTYFADQQVFCQAAGDGETCLGDPRYFTRFEGLGYQSEHAKQTHRVTANFYRLFLWQMRQALENDDLPIYVGTDYKEEHKVLIRRQLDYARSYFTIMHPQLAVAEAIQESDLALINSIDQLLDQRWP